MQMAQSVAQAVAARGGRTYYVGGFVRDALMGRENKDVDIEVHGITPGCLEEILDSPRARALYEGFSCRKATEELCRRCGYARRFG